MGILGKIDINFYVFSEYDPKVLLVGDNSNWLHIEDSPSIIEVTLPGSVTPVVFNYLKNGINSFNSHNLGLSCFSGDCSEEEYINLPDGIYTISVKGSPSTFFKTKYHLKTDKLNLRVDKLLIDLGMYFEESKIRDREDILNIKIYLMIAESHIRLENISEAKTFYDLAVEEVDRIETCKR